MVTTGPFYTAEQIRSRLGISTYVFEGQAPLDREGLKHVAEAGIATLEICDRRKAEPPDFLEEEPATMKGIVAACREFGLTVTSFHSRSISFHDLGLAAEIERSRRMIDHLLELGGKVWGTHVQIEHPETRAGYEALAKHYEGQDLKLVIENGTRMRRVQACIDWIDAIAHPQIGMIFDVGHERNAEGSNPMTIAQEPTRMLRWASGNPFRMACMAGVVRSTSPRWSGRKSRIFSGSEFS